MNLQEILNIHTELEMYKRVATEQNMSLGELIRALDPIDGATPVVFDDGTVPADLMSYRGYYVDLSIVPSLVASELATVGKLRDRLKSAVGETFQGYKGGNFKMGTHTPMWVSNYGCASGMAIKGVKFADGKATIITEQVE